VAQEAPNPDADVAEIEPLPPAASPVPAPMNDVMFAGIYMPGDAAQHAILVERFRNEIHQGWVDDER
jgi:hypothetical protein